MARARSTYKQARLTITEERDREHPGRVALTLRVMVKPVDAEWQMRHSVLHLRETDHAPLADMAAVYRAVVHLLGQPPLPGHIDGD